MTLLRLPGVYRAQDDTSLLIDAMRRGEYARDRRVLDVGSGTGALTIAAARAGAAALTSIDMSRRASLVTWLNSRLRGVAATVHRGDLFAPVAGRRFDLVLTNPPYVPALGGLLPRRGITRCWDGGPDGRELLDRICDEVPGVLAEGGALLLVQSGLSGEDATLTRLAAAGLDAATIDRAHIPFGPVLRDQEPMLRARGLLPPGQHDEELVVIEARRRG